MIGSQVESHGSDSERIFENQPVLLFALLKLASFIIKNSGIFHARWNTSRTRRIYFTYPSGTEPLENVLEVEADSQKIYIEGKWMKVQSIPFKIRYFTPS